MGFMTLSSVTFNDIHISTTCILLLHIPPATVNHVRVERVFILLAHPYVCSPDTSVCMSVDVCVRVSTALAKEVALLLLTDDK